MSNLPTSLEIPIANIHNFTQEEIKSFFDVDYVCTGIKSIFNTISLKNKKIFFDNQNMQNYSNSTFETCDIAFIEYPKNTNFIFKKYNKLIIINVSDYIFKIKNYDAFINECNYFRSLGYFVIFDTSKILGIPGLNVCLCLYENHKDFNIDDKISSPSFFILKKLWNNKVINNILNSAPGTT